MKTFETMSFLDGLRFLQSLSDPAKLAFVKLFPQQKNFTVHTMKLDLHIGQNSAYAILREWQAQQLIVRTPPRPGRSAEYAFAVKTLHEKNEALLTTTTATTTALTALKSGVSATATIPAAASSPITISGNVTAAAQSLGIPEATLRQWIQTRLAARGETTFDVGEIQQWLTYSATRVRDRACLQGYIWVTFVQRAVALTTGIYGQVAQAGNAAPQPVTPCHASANGAPRCPTPRFAQNPSQHTPIPKSPRRVKAEREIDGKTYDQGELAANVKALTQQIGQPMLAPLAEVTLPAPVETSPAMPIDPDAVFPAMQAILERQIIRGAFNTWLRPTQGRFENDVLTLTVPDDTHVYWLTTHYQNKLTEACYSVTGKKPQNIAFIVSEGCVL